MKGRHLDLYMWSCNRSAHVRAPPGEGHRLAPGLEAQRPAGQGGQPARAAPLEFPHDFSDWPMFGPPSPADNSYSTRPVGPAPRPPPRPVRQDCPGDRSTRMEPRAPQEARTHARLDPETLPATRPAVPSLWCGCRSRRGQRRRPRSMARRRSRRARSARTTTSKFSGTLWNPTLFGQISSEQFGQVGHDDRLPDRSRLRAARFKDMRIVLRPSRKAKFRVQYTPIQLHGRDALHARHHLQQHQVPAQRPHRFAVQLEGLAPGLRVRLLLPVAWLRRIPARGSRHRVQCAAQDEQPDLLAADQRVQRR